MRVNRYEPLNLAVSALCVLGLLGWFVPAASAHQAGSSTAHRGHAKPSGTILFSDWQFPDTLNPFEVGLATDYEELYLTMPAGYGPSRYDPTGHQMAGFLAQVPTLKNGGVSKNGLTITFHLQHGLRWSNGQPLVAQDAKFAWQIAMDPAIANCVNTCDNIRSISVPDKYTFVWHMKRTYSAALPYAWTGFIPHAWSKLGGDPHKAALVESDKKFTYEDSSYVTAGPYQVTSWVNNSQIVLQPMKYYNVKAMGGTPRVAKFVFVFYSDKTTMIAAAARHETDLTQNYTLADLTLLNSYSKAFTVKYVGALSPEHLEMNMLNKTVNGAANPLVNAKVRQAINLAIDRYGVIGSAFGVKSRSTAATAISYDAPWVHTSKIVQPYTDPAITGAWDPLRHKYVQYGRQPVADAKTLLAGTPCASGCTISAVTTSGNTQRLAELAVVASNLKAIGITVNVTTQPATQLFATWKENGTLQHGTFELALFAYVGVTPDPDGWKNNMESKFINQLDPNHSAQDKNQAGLRDKLVDQAFEAAAHSFNPSVRRSWYYKAQVEISKQVPWITLSVRPIFVTYDRKVLGVKVNGYSIVDQWNAYSWKAGAL